MVVYYNIAGRQVGSHVLSMAVLGTFFAGTWLATRSGEKKKPRSPPINASSKDEEQFIQDFLKNVDSQEKTQH